MKIMPPKDFFCHRFFVKLDKSVQIKLPRCMKKKFILGNCYLIVGCLDQVCGRLLRSRRFRVIDRKRKCYRRTDRQTWAKQYALSSSKGGIKINFLGKQHYLKAYISTLTLFQKVKRKDVT